MTWPDGTRYESDYWANGRNVRIVANHGQGEPPSARGRGVDVGSDGRIVAGEFLDGGLHGQGVMTMPDGRRLEGRWYEGAHYEGGWRDGTPHGQGVMTLPDGTRYEGEFHDGLYHGRGVKT